MSLPKDEQIRQLKLIHEEMLKIAVYYTGKVVKPLVTIDCNEKDVSELGEVSIELRNALHRSALKLRERISKMEFGEDVSKRDLKVMMKTMKSLRPSIEKEVITGSEAWKMAREKVDEVRLKQGYNIVSNRVWDKLRAAYCRGIDRRQVKLVVTETKYHDNLLDGEKESSTREIE